MTIFYLLGGDDLHVIESRAARIGAHAVGKESILGDTALLGKQYHNKIIYVIDDTPFMRDAIRDKLTEEAQDAGTAAPRVHAYDPPTALRQFLSERPDVVIADWSMQRAYGLNGDELIRRMREMEKNF